MAAVRAAGATKTITVTAMAGGTNNNLLKAQLCPAYDGNKDDMPGMCLVVVVVAAMMVWEGGARREMLEEAATAAAEEANNGRGRQCCAVYSFLVRLFFSLSPPLPLKAKATVRPLSFLPQTLLVDCCLHRFHHCHHCRCWWCRHAIGLLLNLETARQERGVLLLEEQNLLVKEEKEGCAWSTKMDFMSS